MKLHSKLSFIRTRQALIAACVIGAASVCAAESAAEAPLSETPPPARITLATGGDSVWTMPGTPEQLFPLLCPVREYDWIPGWRARLIHSVSGFAEENCIFETRDENLGAMMWVCTRYDPPRYIEYTSVSNKEFVMRLKITLHAEGARTRMVWNRYWYATGPKGEAMLNEWSTRPKTGRDWLKEQMENYLAKETSPSGRG